MDNLTSQELLSRRLVCRLWRDEANCVIRRRQQEFFFSPLTKTRTTRGYNDQTWKQRSCDNVLQISFIYSPRRDTFIRASRRLVEANHPSVHFEATSLDAEEQRIESAFFQEIDAFYDGRLPDESSSFNFNSKMAGYTLDQFTDFLESISMSSSSPWFDRGPSNFSHVAYRFECGRLRDRPEISRFFTVIGSCIRYLTVGVNHMCKGEPERSDEWFKDYKWDHSYQLFRQVPNLQVLTVLVLGGRWMTKIGGPFYVEPLENQPPADLEIQANIKDNFVEGNEKEPFSQLKCLRMHDFAVEPVGHCALWISLKATMLERIVFEMGFAPCLLPILGIVGNKDLNLAPSMSPTALRSPLRLITPITTLCISLLKESPQLIQDISRLLIVQQQQKIGGETRSMLKALHLKMIRDPFEETQGFYEWEGGRGPYNSPLAKPLLEILKTAAPSLETMSFAGAAGVFVENLIQNNFDADFEETKLKSFPNVRTLFFCIEGTTLLSRRDFSSNISPSLNTSLSKVFPKVEEISLGFFPIGCGSNEEYKSWISFSNQQNNTSQSQPSVTAVEVKSVKKLLIASSAQAYLDAYKFSSLQTLCVHNFDFLAIAPAIWGLVTLESLLIDGISVNGGARENVATTLEAAFTGLPSEVIQQWRADLDRMLDSIKIDDKNQGDLTTAKFLRDKRKSFRSLVTCPSIFDLRLLGQLKLMCTISGLNRMISQEFSKPIFSSVGKKLVFGLLPTSCHITIWAPLNNKELPLCDDEMLEKIFGLSPASANPRITVKAIKNDCHRAHAPF